MPIPILIPERDSYGLVLLIVYAVGANSLASLLSRWFSGVWPLGFVSFYLGVMAAVVGWALLLFPVPTIVGVSPLGWLLGLPIGLVVAWAAILAERWIVRAWTRPGLLAGGRRTAGVNRGQPDCLTAPKGATSIDGRFGIAAVIGIAVLEELIHRGVLLRACWGDGAGHPGLLGGLASVVLFSLVHVRFGWVQVCAKLPLSIGCVAAVAGTGCIAPAVCAHVAFNVVAYLARAGGRPARSERAQPVTRPRPGMWAYR